MISNHKIVGESKNEEPELIYMAMGNLDGNPECPPGYHFFVGSKADRIEICDGLPQWEEWPTFSLG